MVALLDAQVALNAARSDTARAAAQVAAAGVEVRFLAGLLLEGTAGVAGDQAAGARAGQ
jgi:hypothetical protein